MIPFVLMPTIGSPAVLVGLALANVALGVALALRARPRSRITAVAGIAVAAGIAVIAATPGRVVQPNEALISSKGWQLFESQEDDIASVQAGRARRPPSSGSAAPR